MYGRDDLSCIVMNGVVRAITVTKLPPMRPNAKLVVEEVEVEPSAGSSMSFCWPIGLMLLFVLHIMHTLSNQGLDLQFAQFVADKGGRVQRPLKVKGPLGYCFRPIVSSKGLIYPSHKLKGPVSSPKLAMCSNRRPPAPSMHLHSLHATCNTSLVNSLKGRRAIERHR